MNCADFRAMSAEFALGVLDARDRALAVAHLEECAACREEMSELAEIADGIAALAPLVEPPNGFESRVLGALNARPDKSVPPKWRRRAPFIAIAAVILALAGFGGWALRGTGVPAKNTVVAELTAARLTSQQRDVGEVVIDRSRSWVSMAIELPLKNVWVTCEVVTTRGHLVDIGSFQVVGGYGYWASALHGSMNIEGARIVSASGVALASSKFAPVRTAARG
ncbi:MAG: zf-HC2 domain-containing protein [Acidimicrobiales bacterium]